MGYGSGLFRSRKVTGCGVGLVVDWVSPCREAIGGPSGRRWVRNETTRLTTNPWVHELIGNKFGLTALSVRSLLFAVLTWLRAVGWS